jgi:hypothetical protein
MNKVSELYHSKFFEVLASVYGWILKGETRRKWVFRAFIVFMVVEIQIHVLGIGALGESTWWYEKIPILGKIMDLFFK